MVPINIISKIVRSRSQIFLATKPIVTTAALWKQDQGGRKSGDDPQGEGVNKQQVGCCSRDVGAKPVDKHEVKKQKDTSPSGELEYLEKKKQGEGTSQGQIQLPDKYDKEKESKVLESEQDESKTVKPGGCGRQNYEAQNAEKKGSQKNTSPCPKSLQHVNKDEPERRKPDPSENRKPNHSQERDEHEIKKPSRQCEQQYAPKKTNPPVNRSFEGEEAPRRRNYCGPVESSYKETHREDRGFRTRRGDYEPPMSRSRNYCEETKYADPCRRYRPEEECRDDYREKRDACGSRKISRRGYLEQEKEYEERSEKRDPCGSRKTSRRDYLEQEKEYEERSEKRDPCGSRKTSRRDCLEQEKEYVERSEKRDPCGPKKTSRNDCLEQEKDYVERSDPCCPSSAPAVTSSSDECEQEAKQFSLDPCQTQQDPPQTQPDPCPEPKEEECSEDPCKQETQTPELPPCCKVTAAKECISKLKELQKQWEEVVAAQQGGRKDDCDTPGDVGKDDGQEKKKFGLFSRRAEKRSNMIYVVLSAILAAVIYYTYNGDFEPEELLFDDEELIEDDKDDDE